MPKRRRSRRESRRGGDGQNQARLRRLAVFAGIIGIVAVLVSSGAITNIFAPRTSSTDVVEDPSGLIGVNQSVIGTGDMARLTNLTNNLDQTVDLLIELTGSSTEWGSLFVNDVDHGNSARLEDVSPGATESVDVALICSDDIAGDTLTYTVDIKDAGITGTLDTRHATIEQRCLTWYTAQDWDNTTSGHGVVHEDFGDHDSADVELGYNTTEPGLEAYWPLDEDSGSTAVDATGNGHNGTISGPTVGQPGILGSTAYEFDGSGDVVNASSSPELSGGSGATISASAWFNADSAGGDPGPGIVGKQADGTNGDWGLIYRADCPTSWDGDCGDQSTTSPTLNNFTDNGVFEGGSSTYTYQHSHSSGSNQITVVVVIWVGKKTQEVSSITYGGNSLNESADSAFTSGNNYANVEIWYIRDADMPNAGTSTVQVNHPQNTQGGSKWRSVAYTFDGVDQTSPFDNATAGNDGDVSISANVSASSDSDALVTGIAEDNGVSYAWNYNETEKLDVIAGNFGAHSAWKLTSNGSGTVTTGGSPSSAGALQSLATVTLAPASSGSQGGNGPYVGYYSEDGGNDYGLLYGTGVENGNWTHAGFSLDQSNNNLYLYVDGKLVNQDESLPQVSANTTADVEIGATTYSSDYFNGTIDEVRVYNRTLSSSEFAALANGSDPHNASAEWNGTHVTAWESTDTTLDVGSLQLSDVVSDVSTGDATVYVESDTDGDDVANEISSGIVLDGSTGPYSVSGLSTDSDRFRLRVELSTANVTTTPCFSGATLSGGTGLGSSRDGCGQENATQNSPPTADFTYTDTGDTWYNDSWENRKKITVDHTQVDADLTNYPMLVSLTDTDLAADTQVDGDDILFTDGDGTTKLDHEIETFNSSSGELVAWVKVPQVNATTPSTEIYLYYNNSAATNQEAASGVWSNDYVLVQHLAETSGSTVIDSSPSDNNGTNNGATQDATGKIGRAYDFETDNAEYVEVPTSSSLNVSYVHYSAWVNHESFINNTGIMAKGGDSNRQYWIWHYNDTFHYEVDENVYKSDYPDLSTATWYRVDIVYNGSTTRAYLNGTLQATHTQSSGTILTHSENYYTGQLPGYQQWDGVIDEVRVRDGSAGAVASDAWIATAFNNTNDPGSFHTTGTEETKDTVSFDASNSSDSDGTIATYKWDFDEDGTFDETTTDPTTTHALDPGETNVTLQVIDDESATDSTTQTVSFLTDEPIAAFSATDTWSKRKTITIDSTNVPADLADYPVLINLTDADLAAGAQADGDDIVFTDGAGAKLPHELETYNDTTGRMVAWVKVTSLSATTDTTLYLYYNNSVAANQENASAVWDSNYKAVWHLNEEPDGDTGTNEITDSSGNNNNGTTDGSMGPSNQTPGQIDGSLNFDGTDDNVTIPDDSSLDVTGVTTFSAWIKIDDWGDANDDYIHQIYSDENISTATAAWRVGSQGSAEFKQRFGVNLNNGSHNDIESDANLSKDAWTHVAATTNGTHVTFYINGSVDSTKPYSVTPTQKSLNWRMAGRLNDSAGRHFDGGLDEIRLVVGEAKSSAWIETEYNNLREPSSFYSVSGETSTVAAMVNATNSSDPDGTVETYKWDWDTDGSYETTANTPYAVHDFETKGTHNVTLQVVDNLGATNTTTKTISVGNFEPTATFTSSSWTSRKPLTIDSAQVSSDLSDYPVLIDITELDLKHEAQADGDDIMFTSSDGETQLDHEIETFNGSTGHLVAWVRVPSVSSSSDTTLYMYFNNSEAANQENVTGVWDSNFKMVQHLNETSGTANDSTANANDGSVTGATQGVTGQIDGGYDFDGSGDNVNVSDDPTLDVSGGFTVSAWINSPVDSGDHGIVTKGKYDSGYVDTAWNFKMSEGGIEFTVTPDGSNVSWVQTADSSFDQDTWTHVVGRYNGSGLAVFIDGQLVDSVSYSSGIHSSDKSVLIGALHGSSGTTDNFNGTIDDARIVDVARSSAWIETTHNNTANPSSFVTVGSEENGTLARFNASASSDPDGTISTYEWDFTNDGTFDETTTNPVTRHRYSATGTYNATLRVTDDEGATNTTTNAITLDGEGSNAGPTADFTHSPESPTTADTVTFDGSSSSDPDGVIDTYKWDWDDDGTFEDTTTSPTIDHSFSTAGDHNVTLEVVDDEAAVDTTTKTVTVSSASFTNETSTANLGSSPGDGVVVFPDINQDGYLDVFMNNETYQSDIVRLRENNGDNTFTDRDSRIDGSTGGRGAGVGDVNNDTYDDLIIGVNQKLHTNDGDGTFTASTPGSANNEEALMFADIDGDGDLDIWSPGENYLWHENTASGWSSQTTMPGGVGALHNAEGATAADINNDGYIDFMWACGSDCASSHVMVFINDGDYTYTYHDNTTQNFGDLPNDVGPHENMEWAWGDFDNDGDLDVYVSGATNEGLYRNDGTGTFTDVTSTAGISETDPDGAAWGDYDNDENLDLVVAQQSGVSSLYSNNGDGTFTDVASGVGIDGSGDLGSTVGFFDSDNDGDLDLITNEPVRFWTNDLNDTRYLRVIVRGNSSSGGSPETPIGAQITVHDNSTGSLIGHREVFASYNQLQPPLRQHFGLDPTASYDIKVRFPSGKVVWRNDTRPDQVTTTIGGTTLNNTIEITEDPIFSDDFNRVDSTTVGNGWTETEPNADDAQILNQRLDFNPDDNPERPVAAHDFATQTSGKIKFEFTFNFERTGSEGTYGTSIQLGDRSSMVDPNTDHDQGVGVNLKWGGTDGTVSGMTDDEGFGYTLSGADTQIGVVSGDAGSNAGGNATITVIADLDANTYNITVTGPGLVSGTGTATDVSFDNNVDLNQIRIFLDEVNDSNFGDLEIDDVEITDEE